MSKCAFGRESDTHRGERRDVERENAMGQVLELEVLPGQHSCRSTAPFLLLGML